MKIAAVITEYNPFHLGHQYQLQQIRQRTQADAVIVLMSGNVVQRGEFAILDKWHRAELALEYGADLVLELPLLASLQSADYFAYWGAEVLDRLKVDWLVFGTETASTQQIKDYTAWLSQHQESIDASIKPFLGQGISYAASYQKAVEEVMLTEGKKHSFNLFTPNHVLAIQYISALNALNSSMNYLAIERITEDNQGHHILSGSQLRSKYFKQMLEVNSLPKRTYQKLQEAPTVSNADYFNLLKYQVLSQDANRLLAYHQLDHGVEHHIYQQMKVSNDYDTLIDNLTSKRWTKATIQRKLWTILLNITKEEWAISKKLNTEQVAIRILGYSEIGREIIKSHRNNERIELFSNLTQKLVERYQLNMRADQVYALNPIQKISEQNIGRYPIYFK